MDIMRIVIRAVLIITLLNASAMASDSPKLPQEIINLGLRFIDNPADFLFDLHSNMEDSVPVPAYRNAQVRFNFFPTFIPFTWAGLNLKVKVLNERRYIPQIDIQGQYGQNIGVAVAAAMMSRDSSSTSTVKPTLYDYTVGLILTKRVDQSNRLFIGPKFSYVNLNFKPSEPLDFGGGLKISDLNVAASEIFIFGGLEHQISKDRFVVSQMAYGVRYNKLMARITASSPHVEVGMNIYPEGVIVIHPFLAWHWYF